MGLDMGIEIKKNSIGTSSIYQITVKGWVDPEFIKRLSDLSVSNLESNQEILATLTGNIKDQSELNGMLNILYDHQYEVISVTKIGS